MRTEDDACGSLWEATAPPAPATHPLNGALACDVAIVGAGYTGLSTALHLAERAPGAAIAVLEARGIGWGASGRNNGQVIPTLTKPDPDDLVARYGAERGEACIALVRDSADLTFDLIRRHAIDCEAVQHGWLQPAHRPGRMALSRRRVEQWARRGARVRLLDRAEMAALLGSEAYCGGWVAETGGHVNPLALTRGLASAAIRQGAAVHTHTPVTGLQRSGGCWSLATPTGTVTAGQVVLATAAYTGALFPTLAHTIVPVRSYQMATVPLGDSLRRSILPGDHAMSDTRGDLHFFRFDRDGRLVTGGALVLHVADHARLRRRVGARVAATFPQAGWQAFDYVWSGDFAATADRFPRLHRLGDGLWSWIGCNGRGLALAIAMGRVLAEAVGGADPRDLPLPVEPLRPIPLHALAVPASRLMLLVYRSRDRRG